VGQNSGTAERQRCQGVCECQAKISNAAEAEESLEAVAALANSNDMCYGAKTTKDESELRASHRMEVGEQVHYRDQRRAKAEVAVRTSGWIAELTTSRRPGCCTAILEG
jgi:hypothetical protein